VRKRIRNREGKSRPLQQRTHLPNLCHRRDAGAEPAGFGNLGLGQHSAQFVQRLTTEGRAEEQAIRLQRTAALHDLAHRIIRPVKRHGMHDQVMGARAQVKTVIGRPHSVRRGPPRPKNREKPSRSLAP
jgi:hypothetical protein